MKDVIKYEQNKEDLVKKFLEKRIEENKELFTKYELTLIVENIKFIKKIYILGLLDISNILMNNNKVKKTKHKNNIIDSEKNNDII